MGSNELSFVVCHLQFDFNYSADFHSVLKLCLDRGFSKLLDNLADHYKHMLEEQHRQK